MSFFEKQMMASPFESFPKNDLEAMYNGDNLVDIFITSKKKKKMESIFENKKSPFVSMKKHFLIYT